MQFKKVLNSLKNRQFKPVYWLQGEEDYFIDAIVDYAAKHILEPHEQEFNQSILYAQDVSPADVVSIVKRFPMMAEYQVVIVKEAQIWKKPEQLLPVIAHPVPTTILIVVYRNKKLDGRLSFSKEVAKAGEIFTSEKIRDYQAAQWIGDHCIEKGIQLDPRAAALLGENLGGDLGKLVAAVEKLTNVAGDSKRITPEMVYQNVGIDKDFNIYELRNALAHKNARKAMLIARYFANNEKEHHILPTLSSLVNFYGQIIKYSAFHNKITGKELMQKLGLRFENHLQEYRIAAGNYNNEKLMEAMEILSETDLKFKGVGATNASSGELTREVVARLLRL